MKIRSIKRTTYIINLLLSALLFINCSFLSQIESRLNVTKCKFRIAKLSKVEYDPLKDINAVTLNFQVDCRNPNDEVETILDKLDFNFFIDNQQVATGSVNRQIKIAPQATEQFPVALSLSVTEIGSSLLKAIQNHSAKYHFTGTAYIDTYLGEMSFDVMIKEGEWSL